MVENKKFREDLYHRLNVMPIDLVPLSSRSEDIPLLIKYFITKLSEMNGVQEPNIDIKNDNFTHTMDNIPLATQLSENSNNLIIEY